MKRTILGVIIAVSAATSAFNIHAEPLQAQAGRDMAAAKAVASLASYNMDKAVKSGNASQISRAQNDLNSALAQVRSTALRAQLAQQRDAQAAAVGQLNALKAQDLANKLAQVTAHMNQVTAGMSATPATPVAQVAPTPPTATPQAPSAPQAPLAPLTVTVNTALPGSTPGYASGIVVGAAPASNAPLSGTTVANTTGPAALQAALTASKMASSVSTPGAAPSTMVSGIKTNPAGKPVAFTYNSSINVNVSTVPASTPVHVGDLVTTAGAVAAIDPNAQISVPMNSVFIAPVRSAHNDHQKHSRSEHGTGNGANNAANSHSARGLGGGSNIGGGKSGGGFHY